MTTPGFRMHNRIHGAHALIHNMTSSAHDVIAITYPPGYARPTSCCDDDERL